MFDKRSGIQSLNGSPWGNNRSELYNFTIENWKCWK